MKAIIMAGGEGTRLRPLTCDCPKPMLKIMGRPIMEYAVLLAKQNGIDQIGVTLGYLPQPVMDYFGDGAAFGADIRYYIEKTPMGTAGSVRMAKNFLDERFIVLSGDGVCDFDLKKALEFHENHRAKATMILKKHASPQEYGMVVLNANGAVRSFHEKPGRCEVYSDLINTGIYILEPELVERIPEGACCDFGRDIFPDMLREGMDIYGYVSGGYWCDVGDVGAYLKVHRDALDGKIGIIPARDRTVSPDAVIEPGAKLELPCCIGAGAHICAGAYIGAYSCIGEGAVVEGGASVKRAIAAKNARIGAGAQLRGCVVGANAVVESDAQLFEESVVGSFSRVGSRAMLMQGVKLWPRKALSDGERPENNIVWGAKREQKFISGRLQVDDPSQAARFTQALVSEMKTGEIIIGHAASSVADAMYRAVIAGAMAQGARVFGAGACSLPQLRRAQKNIGAGCAAFVDEGSIMPLDDHGAMLPERIQRSILKAIERQDYSNAFSGVTKTARDIGDCALSYIAETAAMFRADALCAPKVLLVCENRHVLSLAEQAFMRAGLKVRTDWSAETPLDTDELRVEISPDGRECFISDDENRMDEIQRQLMCAWTLLQMGHSRLLLKLNATRAIDVLCEKGGAHAVYIPGDAAAWDSAAAEKEPVQFFVQTDGIAAALAFLSELTDRGLSLKQWQKDMPAACRSYRRVSMDAKQSGAALHSLFENCNDAQLGGGIRLPGEGGWVWLSPDDVLPEMCVMAESARHETAEELCFFYADALKKLSRRAGD